MTDGHERFGVDLHLLDDLERQNTRERGRDLHTQTRAEPPGTDLDTLAGLDNLRQALLLRFLTHVGELAPLGHPTYGSRLEELLGELNTETTRNRAKMFVLQALAEEPRVAEVLSVTARQNRADRTQVDIDVSLVALGTDTVLNLVFPFFLEGGGAA
jgi:phage baseplate assembly protein W